MQRNIFFVKFNYVIHDFLAKFKPQRLNYIRDSLSSFVFQNSNLLVVTRFQGQKVKFRNTFDIFCLHNLRLCVCVFLIYIRQGFQVESSPFWFTPGIDYISGTNLNLPTLGG
jgi:hypothetical protein